MRTVHSFVVGNSHSLDNRFSSATHPYTIAPCLFTVPHKYITAVTRPHIIISSETGHYLWCSTCVITE